MCRVTFPPAAVRLAGVIFLAALSAGCSPRGGAAGGQPGGEPPVPPNAADPAPGPAGGITFNGKVVDRATGKPVTGFARYVPVGPNPDGAKLVGPTGVPDTKVAEDGTFTLTVAPGPGAVCVVVRGGDYQDACVDPPAFFKDALGERAKQTGDRDWLRGVRGQNTRQEEFHAIHLINPDKAAATIQGELSVEPARRLAGTVTGPDGRPLAGAVVRGLPGDRTDPLPKAEFALPSPNPKRPRTLLAVLKKDRLIGTLEVKAQDKGPLELRLRPWASVTGRLVDAAGEPIAGATVWAGRKEGSAGGRVTTDEDGTFEVDALLPGETYHLTMTSRTGQFLVPDKPVTVEAKAGETKVGDLGVAVK